MITVQEIKDAIQRLRDVDNQLKKLDEEKKPLNEEKDGLKAKITLMLREMNEKSFKSEFGTVTRVTDTSVKLPDGENKQIFFEHLKERGVFEAMATINYQTLNAYYNEQRDIAIQEDPASALNFELPGIGQAKAFETVKFKK